MYQVTDKLQWRLFQLLRRGIWKNIGFQQLQTSTAREPPSDLLCVYHVSNCPVCIYIIIVELGQAPTIMTDTLLVFTPTNTRKKERRGTVWERLQWALFAMAHAYIGISPNPWGESSEGRCKVASALWNICLLWHQRRQKLSCMIACAINIYAKKLPIMQPNSQQYQPRLLADWHQQETVQPHLG